MPFNQILADRIIKRYLEGYNARMRALQSRWAANVASSDPAKRRDGLIQLYEFHDACHEGAFKSMRLRPTDWNDELYAMSLIMTLDQAKVSIHDVEFALLERDTTKIEELSKLFLGEVAVGFTDAPDQQFFYRKELTLPQRTFKWHHVQLINVASVIEKINGLSPQAERLADHEGMPNILARLGTAAGQMDAACGNLKQWLDAHIDDQPS
jgi:hypothetical protein